MLVWLLSSYLKIVDVCSFIFFVQGMQYFENMQFVYRDFVVRNILVVNEDFVKISDFGMLCVMGVGSDYYKVCWKINFLYLIFCFCLKWQEELVIFIKVSFVFFSDQLFDFCDQYV